VERKGNNWNYINQEKERIADDLTDHGNGEWRGISRKISWLSCPALENEEREIQPHNNGALMTAGRKLCVGFENGVRREIVSMENCQTGPEAGNSSRGR
jgi:hypothetical protein